MQQDISRCCERSAAHNVICRPHRKLCRLALLHRVHAEHEQPKRVVLVQRALGLLVVCEIVHEDRVAVTVAAAASCFQLLLFRLQQLQVRRVLLQFVCKRSFRVCPCRTLLTDSELLALFVETHAVLQPTA